MLIVDIWDDLLTRVDRSERWYDRVTMVILVVLFLGMGVSGIIGAAAAVVWLFLSAPIFFGIATVGLLLAVALSIRDSIRQARAEREREATDVSWEARDW